MAGDWIKMRHNLETDPDVLRIAEIVGVDRFSVVGRLHMIWTWADQHSLDGCAVSVTTAFLDEHVSCNGFCDALRKVGWLSGRDWDLSFPNFDRHNGETAKKRAQSQKRMAKSRCANVTPKAQPEKRREEKSNTHTHTPRVPREIEQEWNRWCEFRFAVDGRPIPVTQVETILMDLERRGWEKAKRDIEFSILKSARSILDSSHDFQKREPSTSGRSSGGSNLRSIEELTGRARQ